MGRRTLQNPVQGIVYLIQPYCIDKFLGIFHFWYFIWKEPQKCSARKPRVFLLKFQTVSFDFSNLSRTTRLIFLYIAWQTKPFYIFCGFQHIQTVTGKYSICKLPYQTEPLPINSIITPNAFFVKGKLCFKDLILS